MLGFSDAELTLSERSSQALVVLSVCLGVFFYGGPTQLLQLGVLSFLFLGLVISIFSSLSKGKLIWSHLHTGLLIYSLMLISNLFTSILSDNSRLVVPVFLFAPIVILLLGRLDRQSWDRLLIFLALPLGLSASWGVYEFLTTTGRASGPVLDPNSWASSINLGFFLFSSVWFIASRRIAPVLLVLLTLLATASFMSYSRVGLVIFFAGLLFLVLLALSQSAWRRRVVVLLLVCVTSFSIVQITRPSEGATKNTEGYTLNAEAYGWTVRIAQWKSALRQYTDYPLVGSGLGTFKVLYPQYRSLNDHSTAGNYVHNDYLQLLAESGPLILVVVIMLISFLLMRLMASVRVLLFDREAERTELQRHLELVILIVAIGSVFVHALMNFSFYMLLNQLLMACVLARIIWLSQITYEVSLARIRPGLAKALTLLLVTYVLAVNYADAISHDLVYRSGVLPFDRHDPDDQLQVFEILTQIRGFRSDSAANRFAMATFYRTSFDEQPLTNESGRRSLAIVASLEYQSGLALNPYASDVRGFFATFLSENDWLQSVGEIVQTPESLLQEGIELTPLRLQPRVVYARYLIEQGRESDAYEVLKAGLPNSRLKYSNYEYWRLEWQRMLHRQAEAKGDRETLRLLLSGM